MKGLVIRGSRNIFTVQIEADGEVDAGTVTRKEIECRFKGKILKEAEGVYNPLAPGDMVIVEFNPNHAGTGQIIALEKRRNVFSRFNQKGGTPQLLAANADLVLCLTTAASPPFRPRFLDRVLLQADTAGIPPLVICNKSDLNIDDLDVEERLEEFHRLGYRVLRISAKTGEGLDELRELIAGKCSVLIGQSGVGKSSLINVLLRDSRVREGAINEKYDRGNHTTTMSLMVELSENGNKPTRLIDTPGIRRFVPDGISAEELVLHMREFAPLAGTCTYGLSCSHRVEPGCKIMEAVAAGVIHEDRYNSFLRIYDELAGKKHAG
ncbi:MAG: ribosome small subunit-dependent GTPase A [Treponema sp.]|jgi:ribosome biogenesis GTPase|nr:ribosome small subunit-dependent GTPase A [Treponema sp.]